MTAAPLSGAGAARYPRVVLGTCCVPWNENDAFNEELFRDTVRSLIDGGITHLYTFGTAGEGYAVSDRQFELITRVFLDEMAARGAQPMIGVISLSLSTILERIERAAALGARVLQISLPSWGALTSSELHRFFDAVCGRFPELQFLHYNLARAQRIVTPNEYASLAARHPNLVATKYGGSDIELLTGLLVKAPALRHFFTERGFAYGSLIGECGLLVSIASINPRLARAFFEAGMARQSSTLAAMLGELNGMRAERQALSTTAHMDGAFDKLYVKVGDPRFPLRLLPPYEGVTDELFERFRAALRERFPRWLERSIAAGDPR